MLYAYMSMLYVYVIPVTIIDFSLTIFAICRLESFRMVFLVIGHIFSSFLPHAYMANKERDRSTPPPICP